MSEPVNSRKAGRELDAEVAEKVMGEAYPSAPPPDVWPRGKFVSGSYWEWSELARDWIAKPFSTDIAAAMEVVREVQRRHPGWRFSLLGGDRQWGYRKTGSDHYTVDMSVESEFGWRARWFGEQDPTIAGPFSHADEHADTPEFAICLASLAASQGDTLR